MMDVFIKRNSYGDHGTFGMMTNDADTLQNIHTLERPKTGDHPCIPCGVYDVEQFDSPSKGDVWLLKDVPNRSMIEIHPANLYTELLGCIAVGDSLGTLFGLPAVLNSRATFKKLKELLPDSFRLTISD